MIAARALHPPPVGHTALWLCALLAIVLHGALLFAWRIGQKESQASMIEGDSVEVVLVESAPAALGAIAEPQPPTSAIVPPQPESVPPPEPPKGESGLVLPEAPKPTPKPRTANAATPSPKTTPKSSTEKGTPSPRASSSAGTTGAAGAPPGTAAGGMGIGKNPKVRYIIRPIAAYPPESRAAGEQGIVILRLTVDGSGRPTAVSVAESSGYPRLDRVATEAGWRCRVRDAAPGSQLDAPVRFNLRD